MFDFGTLAGVGFYGILICLFFMLLGAMPPAMIFCLIVLTGLALYFR